MKKRFIFDLDHTLMTASYESEREYFKEVFGDDSKLFTSVVPKVLDEYEFSHPKYDITSLSKFLTSKTGLDFNEDIVRGWIDSFGDCESVIEDGVIDTLEYLKSKDMSLVILTNWFYESQQRRIKNSGLDIYFDEIYAGDLSLKPRREAYLNAIGNHKANDCVYIGDNLEKDYIGPRSCYIEAVLYDKNDIQNKNVVKIKRMNEIKSMY